MISEKSIQEVLEAARIEEVVGEFVELKRSGSNLKGLCPFHNEKTPSFMVSPSKGIYKCFGCGNVGNVSKFLMEHERMSYPEAIRNLGERYSIEIVETQTTKENEQERFEREAKLILMDFASKLYEKNLWEEGVTATHARSYLKERGFKNESLKTFQIGLADESGKQLHSEAVAKAYDLESMEALGLLKSKDGRTRDFFWKRLMFPIWDRNGKVIALAGRVMGKSSSGPKYINSPETSLYEKSKVLYGLHLAKDSVRKLDHCYLVEGYTDVIALHQAGVKNVVASSGTALTTGQLKLIQRFSKNVVLLFDGDEAGLNAAQRSLNLALDLDMNVKFLPLDSGTDPDSLAQEHGNQTAAFLEENSRDFILHLARINTGIEDPLARANEARKIVQALARIAEPLRFQMYLKEVSKILKIEESVLVKSTQDAKLEVLKEKGRINKEDYQTLKERQAIRRQSSRPSSLNREEIQEKHLMHLLIEFGDREIGEGRLAEELVGALGATHHFKHSKYYLILRQVETWLEEGKAFSRKSFLQHNDPDIASLAAAISEEQHALSPKWEELLDLEIKSPELNFIKDLKYSIARWKLKIYNKQINEIDAEVEEATNLESKLQLIKVKTHLLNLRAELRPLLGNPVILPDTDG